MLLQLASRRQRVLLKSHQSIHLSHKSGISKFQAYPNSSISSACDIVKCHTYGRSRPLEILHTHQTWSQSPSSNVLIYWKAVAVGVCGVLGMLDESKPVACATNKGGNEDPLEQVKKMAQDLSTIAMAHFTSLLPENYSNLHKKMDEFLASGKGVQISWGFCMGTCAGFALKKVSKLGAATVGTLFIMLQCASYSGYVNVNYRKLKRDLKAYLDIDQDGVLDTNDLDSMYKLVMDVLEFSLPAGSGFAVGFILGFCSG